MAVIKLLHGEEALVDDDMLPMLSKYRWHLAAEYPRTRGCVHMHTMVMGPAPEGMMVDHIDRNKLNNTRANLRFATPSMNTVNQQKRPTNTGLRCIRKGRGVTTYRVRMGCNGEVFQKRCKTIEEAIAWRDMMGVRLWGKAVWEGIDK